jgi:hypothetical protein
MQEQLKMEGAVWKYCISSVPWLDKLGDPRATLAEQQLYPFHLSQLFQSLVKAAVDGTYNNPFFGDAKSEPGYQKRIRAVMQMEGAPPSKPRSSQMSSDAVE